MNHVRTLVQIRERTFLDILDLAMVVVRERPVTIGMAALAGVAPFAALNAWLVSSADMEVGWLIPLLLMEVPWATAPLTMVLGGIMFGERPRPAGCSGRSCGRSPRWFSIISWSGDSWCSSRCSIS